MLFHKDIQCTNNPTAYILNAETGNLCSDNGLPWHSEYPFETTSCFW